jgi:AcrR family transcriptional regulator
MRDGVSTATRWWHADLRQHALKFPHKQPLGTGSLPSVDEDKTAGRSADRTRRALIDAGWSLLDGITVGEALESLTGAKIARAAGRSERTFWNHFRDWEHYTSELLADMPRRGPMEPEDEYDAVGVVDDALAAPSRSGLPGLVRFAALANWTEQALDEELMAFRRQMFLLSRTGAQPDIAGVVGSDYYGRYIPMLQAVYEAVGEQAGVGPMPPLDWEGFTRTLAALTEGLLMQNVADPRAVTEDFVTEVTTAVALAFLSPTEVAEAFSDREAAFGDPGSGLLPDQMVVDIARSCRPLIDSQGGLTGWGQVSDLVGMPVVDLRNCAQRLSVLEALAFDDPRPFIALTGEVGDDAAGRAFEGICRLTRSARADSVCAASLLSERVAPGGDTDAVRSLVPLGSDLAETLGESTRSHHERIVNIALSAALSDSASSPAEVAELSLAAHPAPLFR